MNEKIGRLCDWLVLWACVVSAGNAMIRWPIKLVIPLGFFLLTLQGLSERIKRIASLAGHSIPDIEMQYERPVRSAAE